MKLFYPIPLFLLLLMACQSDESPNPVPGNAFILEQLSSNYELLPEEVVTVSEDQRVYAQYADPTTKYAHGVMGDKIEAEKLVVVFDQEFYELQLGENHVYEDLRPRLYDVDNDGELEIITIRSSLSKGAGILIYKIIDEEIREYARVSEIGTPNRWLNVVAISDVDKDGIVELIWIETPHIGGILKVAKMKAGVLEVMSEEAGYSNHGLEERNLCLSVLADEGNEEIFYVPNQSRDKIVSFGFRNEQLELIAEVQYEFSNVIVDEVNCINEN